MEKFTTESVKNFETEVDYTTVLDNFEGPLDLLLHLIKEEEIEIKDIFVSQVTEQFLSYMKGYAEKNIGQKEKDIILKLIKEKVDINIISSVSGLSIDEINKFKNEK